MFGFMPLPSWCFGVTIFGREDCAELVDLAEDRALASAKFAANTSDS